MAFLRSCLRKLHEPPGNWDLIALSAFIVGMTHVPEFLHGRLNIHELGLYLPGINAIFHGAIPYRDFFYLRGPLELYVPALMMSTLGKQVGVLQMYFYIGNVVTLLLSLYIACELMKTRYVLILFTLILVGRTFPRVVFTFWGGMRYCLGLAAILLMVQFFKRYSRSYILWAGIFTALAGLTSIDVGVCTFLAICLGLSFHAFVHPQLRKDMAFAVKSFAAGLGIVLVPFMVYFLSVGALVPFLESMWTVGTRLVTVINPDVVDPNPRSLGAVLAAWLNPSSDHFQFLTPLYLYVIVFGWLVYRLKFKTITGYESALACLAFYGLFLFLQNFRGFGGAQFEMALQPEKILLFCILENVYFRLLSQKTAWLKNVKHVFPFRKGFVAKQIGIAGIFFLLTAFFMSTVCYANLRFQRRFPAYQKVLAILTGKDPASVRPLGEDEGRYLKLARGRGLYVPRDQADDLEGVVYVLQLQTQPDDAVLMVPEGAIYHFLADRPFVGRFPTTTLSWLKDAWFEAYYKTVDQNKPAYVVMEKNLKKQKYDIFFARPENKAKYDALSAVIEKHYELKHETTGSRIYKLKK